MARPRKPTEFKVVAGTDRPDRQVPNEPKPRRSRLTMPAYLSARGRKYWPAFVEILDGMRVLTVADSFSLASLCEAFADVQNAREQVPDDGSLTYETVNAAGGTMHRAWPVYTMIDAADRRFAMWVTKFGISPADRSRVSAMVAEADRNPFAKLG